MWNIPRFLKNTNLIIAIQWTHSEVLHSTIDLTNFDFNNGIKDFTIVIAYVLTPPFDWTGLRLSRWTPFSVVPLLQPNLRLAKESRRGTMRCLNLNPNLHMKIQFPQIDEYALTPLKRTRGAHNSLYVVPPRRVLLSIGFPLLLPFEGQRKCESGAFILIRLDGFKQITYWIRTGNSQCCKE